MSNKRVAPGQTETTESLRQENSETLATGGCDDGGALSSFIPVQMYFCEGEVFYFARTGS